MHEIKKTPLKLMKNLYFCALDIHKSRAFEIKPPFTSISASLISPFLLDWYHFDIKKL